MSKKKSKKAKVAEFRPTVQIDNCTFSAQSSPAVTALADAVKANAEAIKALSMHCSFTGPLLSVGERRQA